MKKKSRIILSFILVISLLILSTACGKSAGTAEPGTEEASTGTVSGESAEKDKKVAGSLFSADGDDEEDEDDGGAALTDALFVRPVLIDVALFSTDTDKVKASVPDYTIADDLSNIMNRDRVYVNPEWEKNLIDDGFFVLESGGDEFFEIYESNRYGMIPSFVTVDSLMHSYHLYFLYLQKKTEKDQLYDRLTELTDRMLEASIKQKKSMSPSGDWEDVCDRNIAFFAVGKALLDPSFKPSDYDGIDVHSIQIIEDELELINEAGGITESPLAGGEEYEDYSQYKPRGYYDTDETLKKYFKAMMWYGRRNFRQDSESMDKSAMLISAAMDDKSYDLWSSIYSVTSFFAGESDDNGVCEYRPVIEEAYGKKLSDIKVKDLTDDKCWKEFHELTGKLDPPAINSVPMDDDEGATDKAAENKGFRFMGQRYSIDAAIFQKLIYSMVEENSKGEYRMLPDALDVPAALGSKTAEKILRDDLKAMDYKGYEDNLNELRDKISSSGDETWYVSLYSEWLNTLRPLLEEKGSGYPKFMQSVNWAKRSLEGFLGSYTELKHDTVLYSKQVIAEMGGGEDEEKVDYRGYVEPEPAVYSRFMELAEGTKTGLEKFDLLDDETSEDLDKLYDIADRLKTISEKELKDETLTSDEYDFIEIYGGEIEHFWEQAYKEQADGSYLDTRQFPAPVVVDVATDPNGSVLELATGDVDTVYVVVPVDGTLRIARGSVFNFYQFEQPLSDRMTDHDWRVKLGIDMDDNGEFHWEQVDLPDKPVWTGSYRVKYSYSD